ncbi:MAG: alpha/beta hydrolase [Clostridia bacterium]|nr:alpha/beta hydrolase [Clostridia bacterium]
MKKLFSIAIIALILCALSFGLIACNKQVNVDYGKDNSFAVSVTEDEDAVTYMPKGAKAKYGLLFYVGTMIAPEQYAYLAESLAKQGYAVVIPKVTLGLAYGSYKEIEPAFAKYPNIEFFIGGHSQGGGAAVKRAEENVATTKGVILLAPLCYGEDTIKDSALPTLLLEAKKDGVLTSSMKADAKTRLPDNREEYMLEGCHMSFSTLDDDSTLAFFNDGPATAEVKAAQKEQTCAYVLAFMRAVILGNNAE